MPNTYKEDTRGKLEFQQADGRRVEADFDGGQLTTDGGALLLRELAARSSMMREVAACFTDGREPARIEHSLQELLTQRVLGLVAGYEDLIDHDGLRDDLLWRLLAGKQRPHRQPAAGKSTLQRLEQSVACGDQGPTRYHKIGLDEQAFEGVFTDWFVRSHGDPPSQIILDLDASNTPVYGRQEGRYFNAFYDDHCYLPLFIFADQQLLWAELRSAGVKPHEGSRYALERIVARLRAAWPTVRIIVRGDSHFAREALMRWCEDHGVDYVFGLAKNPRLERALAPAAEVAGQLHRITGRPERVFDTFRYQTRESWSRSRRVVGRADHDHQGGDPRFVVTSLPAAGWPSPRLYEQLYCRRGEMENRIKEQQGELFARRVSAHHMSSNQLRVWLAGVGYWLISELRRLGTAGTDWGRGQAGRLRAELLKIGARIRVSVRRIKIAFSSGYPWAGRFRRVWANLRAAFEP